MTENWIIRFNSTNANSLSLSLETSVQNGITYIKILYDN